MLSFGMSFQPTELNILHSIQWLALQRNTVAFSGGARLRPISKPNMLMSNMLRLIRASRFVEQK